MLCDVHLFAMQPHLRVADLGAAGGLAGRLRALMGPVAARPAGAAALVVFPGHIGTLMALEMAAPSLRRVRRLDHALLHLGLRRAGDAAVAAAMFGVRRPRSALWLSMAAELHQRYLEVFGALARDHGAWIVAGSVALPRNGFGLDAPHFWPAASDVHETSYTFDPDGRNRVEAVRAAPEPQDPLAAGFPRRGDAPAIAETPFGGVATVWGHEGRLTTSRLAAAGARILCRPAARWGAGAAPTLPFEDVPRIAAAVTASLRGDLFEHEVDGPTMVALRSADGSLSLVPARPVGAGGRRDAMAHAVVSGAGG